MSSSGVLVSARPEVERAEREGRSYLVDHWALTTALETKRAWRAQGVRLRVFVNVMPSTLSAACAPAFFEWLESGTADFSRITLALSRGIVQGDLTRIVAFAARCRALGIETALDGFGAGHATPALLRDVRVDTISLDPTFLDTMLTDRWTQGVVRGMLRMAQDIGVRTIAKGVATREQWDWLRAEGCTAIAGPVLAPALSADALSAFVASARR
jgi:EAL domain-containing protein (putative c-di-GMP-specific phosphodiesterase class I)